MKIKANYIIQNPELFSIIWYQSYTETNVPPIFFSMASTTSTTTPPTATSSLPPTATTPLPNLNTHVTLKLDRENYVSWRFLMSNYLEEQ
jgi:hypothetical protein